MFWIYRFTALSLFFSLPLNSIATDTALVTGVTHTGGNFVGADICSECHEEKFEQILPSRHAQMNDLRTPFAKRGCETCISASPAL